MTNKSLKRGLVMRSTGSWYQVLTEKETTIECRIKGKFRLDGIRTTNPIVVGDKIHFEDMEDGTGVIREIEPRKNFIIRKSVNLSHQAHMIAANIDHAYLIVTLDSPPTTTEFMDRFLMTAEAHKIPVSIVFNKIDLLTNQQSQSLDQMISVYTTIGYECIPLSAINPMDAQRFRKRLSGKVNLLSGHSGVGKSTLINNVEKDLNIKTAPISEQHNEGRHTTTFAEIFPLSQDGFIIDTPGIKGFGIIHIEKENIAHYFPEMNERRSDCRFSNCVHINEPKCAIKLGVTEGDIAESRYKSYLSIYNTDDTEIYR